MNLECKLHTRKTLYTKCS